MPRPQAADSEDSAAVDAVQGGPSTEARARTSRPTPCPSILRRSNPAKRHRRRPRYPLQAVDAEYEAGAEDGERAPMRALPQDAVPLPLTPVLAPAWCYSFPPAPAICCSPARWAAARPSLTALVVDMPLGGGHVVMFALRPFWRWQTQGTYFLAFNAILNWDHLDAGKPAAAPSPTTAAGQ